VRIIQIHLNEVGCEDVDWIRLALDKDHWRSLVNMLMNRQVP
jgi:hypothetical protein